MKHAAYLQMAEKGVVVIKKNGYICKRKNHK